MSRVELIAKLESKVRPLFNSFHPSFSIALYSRQKKKFLRDFSMDIPSSRIDIPEKWERTLWGMRFRVPLFNAAGMFKNGEAYPVVSAQGAGAYMAGTTTFLPRKGNLKNGVLHPFSPYPKSGAAINWMGLPNDGHEEVAKRLSQLHKKKPCPIGASLSSSPDQKDIEALEGVLTGLQLYQKAGVSFIELNESCPNVPQHGNSNSSIDPELVKRLEYISVNFLKKRNKILPVVVKISNDTDNALIHGLIDILSTLEFDGLNIGNTSVKYDLHKQKMDADEATRLDYFTSNFGGGLSGRPLRETSLGLCRTAADYVRSKNIGREFHIIRTGGIESIEDIYASESAGVSLNQWYTGYFSAFARYGHKVYQKLFTT